MRKPHLSRKDSARRVDSLYSGPRRGHVPRPTSNISEVSLRNITSPWPTCWLPSGVSPLLRNLYDELLELLGDAVREALRGRVGGLRGCMGGLRGSCGGRSTTPGADSAFAMFFNTLHKHFKNTMSLLSSFVLYLTTESKIYIFIWTHPWVNVKHPFCHSRLP